MISENGAVFAGIIRHKTSPKFSRRAGADVFELLILWNDGRETWESEQVVEHSERTAVHQYWKDCGSRGQHMHHRTWLGKILASRLNPTDPTNPLLDEEFYVSFVGVSCIEWLPKRKVPFALRREYWEKIKDLVGVNRWQYLEHARVIALDELVSDEDSDVDEEEETDEDDVEDEEEGEDASVDDEEEEEDASVEISQDSDTNSTDES